MKEPIVAYVFMAVSAYVFLKIIIDSIIVEVDRKQLKRKKLSNYAELQNKQK